MVSREGETAQSPDSPRPRAPLWQGILIRLGLALFGLVLAAAVLEVGLRVALGPVLGFHLSYWKYHPLLGHTHPLNLEVDIPFPEHPDGQFRVATSNHSPREDLDTSYGKDPGTFRVLVLGDSHTDGTVNNTETYPNVLESALVGQDLQADVLNAGVESYSPFTELLWFHFYGRLHQPDLVLAGIYVGNDMKQMKGFENISIAQDGTVLIDGKPLLPRRRPFSVWFVDQLNRSYLYGVLKSKWSSLAPEGRVLPTEQAFRTCRGCYWQNLEQAYYFHSGELDLDQVSERLRITLTEFKRQVDASGARLVIVLIPTKRQVEGPQFDPELFDQAADMLGLSADAREFDGLALRTALAVCDQAGVESLNLLPGLREALAETGEPLYYTADWHLNPAGHWAVASLLQEILP